MLFHEREVWVKEKKNYSKVSSLKNRKGGVLFIEIEKTVRKAGLEEEWEFSFGILSLQYV